MKDEPKKIREGINMFEGKIARNLLLEPMVSHSYFIEDGDEAILFDPSCGKKIGRRVESFIRERLNTRSGWKKAVLIAGHSHIDHANNFYLSDVLDTEETCICVHECGFQDGKVKNEPYTFVIKIMEDCKEHFNPYLALFFPYNLIVSPFAALDKIAPELAVKMFSFTGSLFFPRPVDGKVQPKALKEEDMEQIDIGGIKLKGWKLSGKIIFPTPGHSPCSVTLLWPEKKALFVSDADWIGNPTFLSGSLRDSLASLEKLRVLAEAGLADLLLPVHGEVKEGQQDVMRHLDFHIQRLKLIKSKVLSFYHSSGRENNVSKLTHLLVKKSPLFKLFKYSNYPRQVLFVKSMVALCLKEEGLLP